MIDLLAALLNQRPALLETYDRLQLLRRCVARPTDLGNLDWLLFYGLAVEMRPDVIVELGRGFGNSTCVFTQAANDAGSCRVVSIDRDFGRTWVTQTLPRLQAQLPEPWFAPLEVLQGDIVDFSARQLFGDAQRVLLLWDAHGDRVGAHVLGELLPYLAGREHLVILHDVTDARWQTPLTAYGGGENENFWQGHFVCSFREIYAAFDFLSRNRIEVITPAQAVDRFRADLAPSPVSLEELYAKALDMEVEDGIASGGHWLAFDMHDRSSPFPLQFPPPPGSLPLARELGRALNSPTLDRLLTRFAQKRAAWRAKGSR